MSLTIELDPLTRYTEVMNELLPVMSSLFPHLLF